MWLKRCTICPQEPFWFDISVSRLVRAKLKLKKERKSAAGATGSAQQFRRDEVFTSIPGFLKKSGPNEVKTYV